MIWGFSFDGLGFCGVDDMLLDDCKYWTVWIFIFDVEYFGTKRFVFGCIEENDKTVLKVVLISNIFNTIIDM